MLSFNFENLPNIEELIAISLSNIKELIAINIAFGINGNCKS